MAFDDISLATAGLNPVGSNSPLYEVLRTDFLLLILKDSNEQFTNDVAFFLRFRDSCKRFEVAICRVYRGEFDSQFIEHSLDLFGLVLSHQTGVDIDAVEKVADGTACENCCNR